MKTCLMALALGAGLALAAPAAAPAAETVAPYALLFREGTLDALPHDRALIYQRQVTLPADEDFALRQSGALRLAFAEEAEDEVRLGFGPDAQSTHVVGSFPASVGNPLIMYHMETVVRDMAQITGGSQFYIRNRMKDALSRPAEVEDVTVEGAEGPVAARQVVFRPFEGDANAARMQGFGGLEIRAVMSAEIPGWYRSLSAEVPDGKGGIAYSSEIVFEAAEAAP
ncbi:hypothetical protein [Poseidonocella sp. HB161398]|uniref:hypothetical protein n=1 Tax=Poseidonocella sp. HB161398 TaxID=2320855 RepID=UPI001F0DDBF5|nr:hypothetical protein [Poseidonocella sp. HB161398]